MPKCQTDYQYQQTRNKTVKESALACFNMYLHHGSWNSTGVRSDTDSVEDPCLELVHLYLRLRRLRRLPASQLQRALEDGHPEGDRTLGRYRPGHAKRGACDVEGADAGDLGYCI